MIDDSLEYKLLPLSIDIDKKISLQRIFFQYLKTKNIHLLQIQLFWAFYPREGHRF